ncbi:LytTR family two component transcriptional regulator [Alkalibaculum bacchi]|uniref:Stage 0 sporulation protein A homolog n=1 Tax=Alkalibaculum bacchi TaxID=645887 RepID=A0A366I9X0_9FIRM|nr:LytTR family DNA-binding domain-containing protein [Alkalibaculum bacchi]RBP66743.1 LytTR family two component transcriptional regulator [Alkalibaculum bacchi]
MSIRTILIDDEYLSIEELSFLLSKATDIEIIGRAYNGIEGLKLIKDLKPDLVFLDIQMPDMTGLELSKEINKLDIKCKIIFSTAYDKYALEAFDVEAIDYILKPFEEQRVLKAVNKAKNLIQDENTETEPSKLVKKAVALNKLSVLKEDKILLIDIKSIIVIYTEDRNIYIKTKEETFHSNYSIQELEKKLSDKGFFRTHRSFLVNLNKIKEISPWFNGSYMALLDGYDGEVPISRNNVKAFKNILGI